MRVISLGAGVQSTTMALMAAAGEIGPMPDCAIFADTGAEPKIVYDHLHWLASPGVLPFPIHIVRAGDIKSDMLGLNPNRTRFAAVPFFLLKTDGTKGMGRRQCTKEYKIEPIMKKQRELLGYRPRQRIPQGSIETWIGISTDEIQRMKDAPHKWQTNRWPLIEKRMSRIDCIAWLERNGFPRAPKSACTFCPYRNNAGWAEMRANDPLSWNEAVDVDAAIRGKNGKHIRLDATPFLHPSLRPLSEVDFSTPAERGQIEFGFNQECDGMCGV